MRLKLLPRDKTSVSNVSHRAQSVCRSGLSCRPGIASVSARGHASHNRSRCRERLATDRLALANGTQTSLWARGSPESHSGLPLAEG